MRQWTGGSSLPIHRLSISFPLLLEASGSHGGCLGTCWDEAHKLPLGACTEAWSGSGSYHLGVPCVPGPTVSITCSHFPNSLGCPHSLLHLDKETQAWT